MVLLGWYTIETHRTNGLTQQALENTRDSDRPWIGVGLVVDSFEVDKAPNVTIAFQNSGRRPAKVTLTQYRWVIYGFFPANPEYPVSNPTNSKNIILPNAQSTVTFTMDKITEQEMAIFKMGSPATLYIHTNIQYEDPVTHAEHWTHACWQYIYFEKGIHSGFYNCGVYNEAQ